MDHGRRARTGSGPRNYPESFKLTLAIAPSDLSYGPEKDSGGLNYVEASLEGDVRSASPYGEMMIYCLSLRMPQSGSVGLI